MNMPLEIQIEGVLFYKAEPMKKAALAEIFQIPVHELDVALTSLGERLRTGGTRLVVTDTSVQLVTAPEVSNIIDAVRKEDLSHDIGRAGAETLAIILYRGPLSRAEIDRVRGVNSTFILRNLLVRGLIERREHPTDARSFVYAATPSLMNHLGITKREDMPEFQNVMDSLEIFEREEKTRENTSEESVE